MTTSINRFVLRHRKSAEEKFLLLCCSILENDQYAAAMDAICKERIRWDRVRQLLLQYPFRDYYAPLWIAFERDPGLRGRVPPDIVESIDRAQSGVIRKNRERMAAVVEILDELDRAGLRPVVLKGPAMLFASHHGLASRPFADADLLFDRIDTSRAEECVRSLGYRATEEHELRRQHYLSEHHHLPPLYQRGDPMRLGVEIQWRASGYLKEFDFTNRLLANSLTLSVNEKEVRVPSPEYLFVHSILDSASHSFFKGLRNLCDLRAVVEARTNEMQWDKVEEELRELGVTREASLVLRLLPNMLGCHPYELLGRIDHEPLPEAVLRASEEVALRQPTDRILFWKLLADRLTKPSDAWHPRRTAGQGAPKKKGLARWFRHGYRVLTTLPNGLAMVRGEAAETTVCNWIVQQHTWRASKAQECSRPHAVG